MRLPDPAQELLQSVMTRGIHDPRVLAALAAVPRERFVPYAVVARAYEDRVLPIGSGQTISQPTVVALMSEALALRPSDRVLEIGSGSGYGAAVLAQLAREVYTVERVGRLARLAAARLAALGMTNVRVLCGDGTLGWPEHAPYDAISVTAGGPQVPPPLIDQLAIGGRLVIPLGASAEVQRLVRVHRRSADSFASEDLGAVYFVPLIGAHGFREDSV